MAEKSDKTQFYAYVQRPGEKQFLQAIFAHQNRASNVEGVFVPERCASCDPDSCGVFTINTGDEFFGKKLAAMEKAKKELNRDGQVPRLIGPFDSYAEAQLQSVIARPLTTEQENAELKRKIKELEAAAQKKEK